MKTPSLLLFLFLWFATKPMAAQTVLAEGEWYKLAITETGIYKIDADFLKKAGIYLQNTAIKNLRIFGNGGAMLPQANVSPRPQALKEIACWTKDNAGIFGNDNFLLFYGESPHKIKLSEDSLYFSHERNVYSDTTYYFFSISTEPGIRMTNIETAKLSLNSTKFTNFDAYFFMKTMPSIFSNQEENGWENFLTINKILRFQ